MAKEEISSEKDILLFFQEQEWKSI